MLSKLLKSKGHHIEEAADGQIAVDKVMKETEAGRSYDVILMDFVMVRLVKFSRTLSLPPPPPTYLLISCHSYHFLSSSLSFFC